MSTTDSVAPRVVIVGAGIVGANLADELTGRGWTDVTVVEQGPLPLAGGSTSHAPGLVFQTNASRTLTAFASYTAEKLAAVDCFDRVGGLEVAATPERLADLHRKQGWASSRGVPARVVDAAECARLHPLIDTAGILGGLHTPTDGLAAAARAVTALRRRATARGAVFRGSTRVTGIDTRGGRVRAVRTDRGELPADILVTCAGFWGRELAAMVGMRLPLLPMAHQYARTGQVPGLDATARLPILRHQDRDLYYRQHDDQLGIGSYAHRPMPVRLDELPEDTPTETHMPSVLPFTEDDFTQPWEDSRLLLPALRATKVDTGFNGVMSFTPDGGPLIGESADVAGFWTAEAVWVTHSAGVARAVAELLTDGRSRLDLHGCSVHRFSAAETTDDYVAETAAQNFVEVYDVVHLRTPRTSPRDVRVSPFHARQRELGAAFADAHAWERPLWYESNAELLADLPAAWRPPVRDEWSARFHSPVAAVEAWRTRTGVALYDMTPLTRVEVRGPGAATFLDHLTTGTIGAVGKVTYALLLDEAGGVRSDLTVSRLADERFLVCANSSIDVDHLTRAAAPVPGVEVRDVTEETCGLGLWGPLARDLLAPLTADDVSAEGLRYFRCAHLDVAGVPVTALRVSYVGELGWELYTAAEHGVALWDALWAAGRPLGVVAAGRAAFDSLRLEKGYRSWGTDMTSEHDPYEAGVGFAVRAGKGPFVGRDALVGKDGSTATRRLTCLTVDDGATVLVGQEPVVLDGAPAGYVTSAAFGHTVGRPVAYAWLPTGLPVGTGVEIRYFDRSVAATVAAEPLVDPEMHRIRR